MYKKLFGFTALALSMMFSATTQAAETRIGITIYKYDDNFMSIMRKDFEKEAKKTPDIKLLINDSQNSQSTQNDQVDVLLAKGVKALAINLIDPGAASAIIEKARISGTPIVFFNREPNAQAMASYDKAYYVGTDSAEAGILQAELIKKHWQAYPEWDLNKDGQIQYVLLKGELGHPEAEARAKAVVETLHKEGIKIEQLHMDTAMSEAALAKDKMDAWLSGANGNKIELVIATNDAMAMGAIEALKAHNKVGTPVYGVDALQEVLGMLKSGAMVGGTILNDAGNQAKATFLVAKNLAEGKPANEGSHYTMENKIIRVPYVAIDKDNLSQFIK